MSRRGAQIDIAHTLEDEKLVEEKVLGPVKQDKIRLESAKSNMGGDLDPKELAKLANFHRYEFGRLDSLEDLEQAIKYDTLALELTPDDHTDLLYRLASLGLNYTERFQRLGDLDALAQSIKLRSRAVELSPDDHPDLPEWLNDLGVDYGERFQRLGDINDLTESIKYNSRAIILTPDGHPNLPRRLANIGVDYNDRFQILGDLKDLEQALTYSTWAVALNPSDHPDLPRQLGNLGINFSERFRRLGNMNDLTKSIEYKSRAVALTRNDPVNMARRLANLGLDYTDRFLRLDDIEDLAKAIDFKSRAIALAPEGHPDLARQYGNLGVDYSERFRRLGDLNDLEKSLDYKSRALKLTPDNHPGLAGQLSRLGVDYSHKYQRLEDIKDLGKAIEYFSRSVALIADSDLKLPNILNSLGVVYGERFLRLGFMKDLETAIENQTRAVKLSPHDHPDLPRWLANLGFNYGERFKRQEDVNDLERSITCFSSAVALTPNDHPDLPWQHFNLAQHHITQFERTGDYSNFDKSMTFYRAASQSSAGSPRKKFAYAYHWAQLAFKYSPPDCLEAYRTAIDLLPQFIWLGATVDQRYQDLLKATNLASEAASGAILFSKFDLALEWLEYGRCVVWNQNLTLRSPLSQLHATHPNIAACFEAASEQLYQAGFECSASHALTSHFDPSGDRHKLAADYNRQLTHIRKLTGFENFLRPIKYNQLILAARNGPVVLINCDTNQCDALIILPKQATVTHLHLPEFTEEKAQKARIKLKSSLRYNGVRERGVKIKVVKQPEYEDEFCSVLFDLWISIVKPVLQFLGYMNNTTEGNLPHITWCPTGTLSFLPLHAAGNYDEPRSRVFNYVVSSYTPTLTVLVTPFTGSPSRSPRVLAIGQTFTPGLSPLLGTIAELESIKTHTEVKGEYLQLTGDQVTRAAVLDAMEQYDWVHLACHAHQNAANPTKSGFYLHDGTLNLTDINRRSFKDKGLAFLSACQTAKGDEELPDEAIHLASGMLMAGYSSVIATRWSVFDDDAPFVADRVYEELMQAKTIRNGESGRALHNAVAALRSKVGEKEFVRWAQYVHIGS
ncbi:hypothetical protein RSOLAG1IB_09089 [Rhizoctonia solani AG-1 IB]|uniref:CHAT domain-containing protein n=1 Tax=Thanatephorus cucumeris (strain AG1-IB / isolate 7/3/14) TaxID=1108050 RepID=M5C184_THACB|nr:hypothetical protein BN14_07184 [Rhizoctonia solani AG-1 IB]CEL59101.1 hypothetical protein RSOLAG1IB_09089 [Rhizoctonia solani AG-1 IB]